MEDKKNVHIGTRIILTKDLDNLKKEILFLGNKCCESIAICISSLLNYDKILEEKIKNNHLYIKDLCLNVENKIFLILSLQQPLLKDLRLVISTLSMCHQFYRISDICENLVYISELLEKSLKPEELILLNENSQSLLKDSLIAFETFSLDFINELMQKENNYQIIQDNCLQKITKNNFEIHIFNYLKLLERLFLAISSIQKEIYFINSGIRKI